MEHFYCHTFVIFEREQQVFPELTAWITWKNFQENLREIMRKKALRGESYFVCFGVNCEFSSLRFSPVWLSNKDGFKGEEKRDV